MDDNRLRRVDNYNKQRIQDEHEEERLRRERLMIDERNGWEASTRRRKILDNQERQSRAMKEHWHRSDEDRYKYKRFRKGSEPVEAWWLDPNPQAPYSRNGRYRDRDYWNKYY